MYQAGKLGRAHLRRANQDMAPKRRVSQKLLTRAQVVQLELLYVKSKQESKDLG
jgi:hypothetical protein